MKNQMPKQPKGPEEVMKKSGDGLEPIIEEEISQYMKACYANQPIGFGQYKVARESFLAGLHYGINRTKDVVGETDPKMSVMILTVMTNVTSKLAGATIAGQFPVDESLCGETFEAEKKDYLDWITQQAKLKEEEENVKS